MRASSTFDAAPSAASIDRLRSAKLLNAARCSAGSLVMRDALSPPTATTDVTCARGNAFAGTFGASCWHAASTSASRYGTEKSSGTLNTSRDSPAMRARIGGGSGVSDRFGGLAAGAPGGTLAGFVPGGAAWKNTCSASDCGGKCSTMYDAPALFGPRSSSAGAPACTLMLTSCTRSASRSFGRTTALPGRLRSNRLDSGLGTANTGGCAMTAVAAGELALLPAAGTTVMPLAAVAAVMRPLDTLAVMRPLDAGATPLRPLLVLRLAGRALVLLGMGASSEFGAADPTPLTSRVTPQA